VIKLIFKELKQDITEDDIKKEAASLPLSFCEKNSVFISEITSKKHRPSVYRSLSALNLLVSLLPQDITLPILKRSENGRPYFENIKNVDFSISHTDSLAVCALCQSQDITPRIGIDAEEIYNKDPVPLAERFFAVGEKKYFYGSDSKEKTFTEIWTKKEAYIKYLGTGLSTPLTSFDTTTDLGVHFETFRHRGNIVTVCAKKEFFPLKIK